LAYTNTVKRPVIKNDHQTQFPDTPLFLTISVTKFGVSVEKVVATIEIPRSHQGIVRPDKKYSEELLPDFLATTSPIIMVIAKKKQL